MARVSKPNHASPPSPTEPMNFLILGDGAEEHAWAIAIRAHDEHRLWLAYPGFDDLDDVPRPLDFEDALARAGIEAAIVGGPLADRGEWLRRVAAVGLPAICLHPPGDDSEAYYQVALSRAETGAILVPDLPARLHPGVESLRRALGGPDLGGFRGLRHEAPAADRDLARHAFSRTVDVVRSLLGEVEAVTATGDPPGEHPDENLVVQLRGPEARRAEVRLWAGPPEPARLVLAGESGTLTLEYDPDLAGPSRLIGRSPNGGEQVTDIGPWDRHGAILGVLEAAVAGRAAHPDLLDGTRAMELAEATVRSLRRGRTVDLHYEEISEAGTFKSVMTSTGCVLLLSILFVLPAALAGPALGLGWTIFIAYAIPPLLVVFILLQTLRFAVRDRK
jgi:predicted dehydrogenase